MASNKNTQSNIAVAVETDVAKGSADLEKFNSILDKVGQSLLSLVTTGPLSKDALKGFNTQVGNASKKLDSFSETLKSGKSSASTFGKALDKVSEKIEILAQAASAQFATTRREVAVFAAELTSKLDFSKLTPTKFKILEDIRKQFEQAASASGVSDKTLEKINQLVAGEIDLKTALNRTTDAQAAAILSGQKLAQVRDQLIKSQTRIARGRGGSGSDGGNLPGNDAASIRAQQAESFLRATIGTIPDDLGAKGFSSLNSAVKNFISGVKSQKFDLADAVIGPPGELNARALEGTAAFSRVLEEAKKLENGVRSAASTTASTKSARAALAGSFAQNVIGEIPADATKKQLDRVRSAFDSFVGAVTSKKFSFPDLVTGGNTLDPAVIAARAALAKLKEARDQFITSGQIQGPQPQSKAERLLGADTFLSRTLPASIPSGATPQSLAAYSTAIQQFRTAIANNKFSLSDLLGNSGQFNARAVAATAALEKLREAAKQLSPEMKTLTERIKEFGKDQFKSAAKITLFTTMYRAVRGLQVGLLNATKEAAEYIIKINEIRSINQETGESFDFISNKLQDISRKLGLPVLDVAEAAYQTLSNQVAKGAEAFQFLDSAGKLAVASVSDISTSVNALSTVLNGYSLSSTEADKVSAILFKGVEVGRFRLKDLDNAMSKVIPTASALGVSFEEVIGALSAFTIRGVRVEQASTLLNNVLLGLLKPTSEATKFFNQLGYANGRGALSALGLANTFKLLNDELQRNPEHLAKIANDMRELRGIALAGGKTFNDFVDDIAKVSNATESFNNAIDINLNNAGREFKKFEQDWNTIWRSLGEKAVTGFNFITKSVRGIADILSNAEINNHMSEITTDFEAAVRGMSLTTQKETTEIDSALTKFAQGVRQKIASSSAAAAVRVTELQSLLAKTKQTLNDTKPAFLLSLNEGLKETERLANQARSEIEKIKGTSQKDGLINKARQDLANTLAERNLNAPQGDLSGRALRPQIEKERLQREINRLLGGAFGTGKIAGTTSEDVEANTKRLLDLENRLDALRGSSGNRLVSYAKVTSDITRIYAAQEVALKNILATQEKIRKEKEQELKIGREREALAKNIISDVSKFDLSKIKEPGDKQKAFADLIKRVGENESLFKQDANFNTALNLRLSLLKQELDLSEKIRVENSAKIKGAELGEKAAKIELDRLKEELKQAKIDQVGFASNARAKIASKDELPLGSGDGARIIAANAFSTIDKDLEEFVNNPQKINNLLRTVDTIKKARRELNNRDAEYNTVTNTSGKFDNVEKELTNLYNAYLRQEKAQENLTASTKTFQAIFSNTQSIAVAASEIYKYVAALEALRKTIFDIAVGRNAETSNITDQPLDTPTEKFGGRTFRHGGRGSDSKLALISPSEMVMSAAATKQYYTQLSAMNKGSNPRSYNAGGTGSVTNVGDVHVSISGQTNGTQVARQIGSEIRREMRRGTLG